MILYNISMAVLFLISLGFFIFISVDTKKNCGDFEEQKREIEQANKKRKSGMPFQIHPSKWYNKFRTFTL